MRIPTRLPVFLLVSVLTFGLGVWFTRITTTRTYCPRFSPWEMLLKYENQDLQGLDEESRRQIEVAVEAVTGKRNEHQFGRFSPQLFRLMSNTKGEQRYVLVELAPLEFIPGNCTLRVHVFDTAGRLLSVQEFSNGHRTSVTSMRIRHTGLTTHPLLIVDAQYCLGGHPSTQFYALTEKGMALVYLEQDGRINRTSYPSSNMTIGPEINRSIDEWENALASSDDAV